MFYNIVFVVNKVDIEFDSLNPSGALGVGNLTIIGFQIITNAGISLIGPQWNSKQNSIIFIKNRHLKKSSDKWRPFCLAINLLRPPSVMWFDILRKPCRSFDSFAVLLGIFCTTCLAFIAISIINKTWRCHMCVTGCLWVGVIASEFGQLFTIETMHIFADTTISRSIKQSGPLFTSR